LLFHPGGMRKKAIASLLFFHPGGVEKKRRRKPSRRRRLSGVFSFFFVIKKYQFLQTLPNLYKTQKKDGKGGIDKRFKMCINPKILANAHFKLFF